MNQLAHHDLAVALLLAAVREPDEQFAVSFAFGARRRFIWNSDHAQTYINIQLGETGWCISERDIASGVCPEYRAIAFADLLAKFTDPDYRQLYELDPP